MNKEIIEEMLMTINDYIEHLEKENKTLHNSIKGKITSYRSREVDKIQKRIDKALEYVENYFIFNDKTGEYYQTHTFDKDNVKKLYDILKGGSDEK